MRCSRERASDGSQKWTGPMLCIRRARAVDRGRPDARRAGRGTVPLRFHWLPVGPGPASGKDEDRRGKKHCDGAEDRSADQDKRIAGRSQGDKPDRQQNDADRENERRHRRALRKSVRGLQFPLRQLIIRLTIRARAARRLGRDNGSSHDDAGPAGALTDRRRDHRPAADHAAESTCRVRLQLPMDQRLREPVVEGAFTGFDPADSFASALRS